MRLLGRTEEEQEDDMGQANDILEHMREWCKDKIGQYRSPGPWWKQEVLDKHERGDRVSVAALELARGTRQGAR